MIVEKYPHLPQAAPDHWRPPLDDAEFDIEVDRDPYDWRRPGPEPRFAHGLMVGIATVLVMIVGVGGLIAIIRW